MRGKGPGSFASNLSRLERAWFAGGLNFLQRSHVVGMRYLAEAALTPWFGSGRGPWASRDFSSLVNGYRDYFADMAIGPGVALGRARDQVRSREPRHPRPAPGGAGDQGPVKYQVAGRPFMLPARVLDSSQGIALFAVPAANVRAVLAEQGARYRPVPLGPYQTPIIVYIGDYRESDFGSLFEIGIGFLVVPLDGNDHLPGMYTPSILNSTRYSRDVGRIVWGYEKHFAPHLKIFYGPGFARCVLDDRVPDSLAITLPRGGTRSSTAVPFASYTMQDGLAKRTLFTRNGADESLTPGAAARLSIGAAPAGECACCPGADPARCFCRLALRLGLPRPALLTAWSERMSGEFGPAMTFC